MGRAVEIWCRPSGPASRPSISADDWIGTTPEILIGGDVRGFSVEQHLEVRTAVAEALEELISPLSDVRRAEVGIDEVIRFG